MNPIRIELSGRPQRECDIGDDLASQAHAFPIGKGMFAPSSIDEQEIVATNLSSVFLCSKQALRLMKPQKRGRIINIGSISAKMPRPNAIGYTATKFAVEGMTRSLALDGREFGITASVVHPGATVSELAPNMAERPAAQMAQAEEVAAVIVLMASMPDTTNMLDTTILPIAQPFLGRG